MFGFWVLFRCDVVGVFVLVFLCGGVSGVLFFVWVGFCLSGEFGVVGVCLFVCFLFC